MDLPAVSMSVTCSDRTATHLAPDEIFDELLWSDPDYCNRCFRRFRDRKETEVSLTQPKSRDMATDSMFGGEPTYTVTHRRTARVEATDYGHDVETGAHQVPVDHFSCYVCGECGSVRGLNDTEPASRQEMLDRVEAIADRLEDYGIRVDRSAMRKLIHGYHNRQLTGRELEAYRRATKLGVSRARKQDRRKRRHVSAD